MSYKHLLVSQEHETKIAVVQLNRPQALNALCFELMDELIEALEALDKNIDVNAIVLTGNEKAFAAGADIKEFAERNATQMLLEDRLSQWKRIEAISKPLIAAVSGFALGGGCELMLHCDIVIASETVKLGQPEINIGVIPGAGGTQRLTKLVGKFKAMEFVLTGRFIDAKEALELKLVNKIVPVADCLEEAKKLARDIAAKAPIAARAAKVAVRKALETTLDDGLEFERQRFYLLFDTDDKNEGMQAFIEKRKPQWTGK